MKICWNVSEAQWNSWIERLKHITYYQNQYISKTYIQCKDPATNYRYYGFVGQNKFEISPSTPGMYRMPVVLSGHAVKKNNRYRVIVKVQFVKYIRVILYVVWFWFIIAFFFAMVLVKEPSKIYFLCRWGILMSLVAVSWFIVNHRTLLATAKKEIPFLESLLL